MDKQIRSFFIINKTETPKILKNKVPIMEIKRAVSYLETALY